MPVDDVGRASLPGAGIPLLHPEEQTFEDMLQGWRRQQMARNLSAGTVADRERLVRRFA